MTKGARREMARLAHPRLKGCTRTEFQACAQYLLGISSRHISVVTRRIPTLPNDPPIGPIPADTAWHETIFYLQRALLAGCRFFLSCVHRNFSPRHSAARRPDFTVLNFPFLSFSFSSLAYLYFSFTFPLTFLLTPFFFNFFRSTFYSEIMTLSNQN